MNKYRKVKEIVQKKVLSSIVCDVCNKTIKTKLATNKKDKVSEYFYIVATSHRDWGNDSIDSLRVRSACCDDCLRKIIDEYLSEKSNTKTIEIKKEYEYFKFSNIVEFYNDQEYSEEDCWGFE